MYLDDSLVSGTMRNFRFVELRIIGVLASKYGVMLEWIARATTLPLYNKMNITIYIYIYICICINVYGMHMQSFIV